MQQGQKPPTPELFFETVNAYQRSAAIKAAVELDLFTQVAAGEGTAVDVGRRIGAAERGVRILCDALTVMGFLTKEGDRYRLTADTGMFLDRRSPGYAGGAIEFLLSPLATGHFEHLAASVRKGGSASDRTSVTPDHPVWVQFARGMGALMAMPAERLAALVDPAGDRGLRVLDIAAGHGLYGIAFAARNSKTRVVGVDWGPVLEVARENAAKRGVADRYETIAGSAFEVDFSQGRGTRYDVVLLPNFLHHFDVPTCEALLRKVRGALADGGRVATVEFIPNPDRVTPPTAAMFALTMLAHTPGGDAYTQAELEGMFRRAGFGESAMHELGPSPSRVMISTP